MRILFVINNSLGWKTLARHVEEQASTRPDLTCTFHCIESTLYHKVMTRSLPILKRGITSQTELWRRHVQRHLGSQLRAGAFDVVVCMGQGIALAVLECVNPARTAVAVSLDTTGASFARDLSHDASFDASRATEEKSVYDRCAMMLPWSDWAGRSLTKDYGIGGDRILVCPPSGKHIGVSAAPRSHVLPRVIFVGNDFDRKGGPDLVRWHQSRLQNTCELQIVSARAPKGLVGVNLISSGAIPNARLTAEVLPQADIFCLPTRHDMSPYALAEAQLSGLPCVSTKLAGIPELVEHEQTGLLVDVGDEAGSIAAISRLCADAPLRQLMANRASERSREVLNAAVTYPRLFEHLKKCVQGAHIAS